MTWAFLFLLFLRVLGYGLSFPPHSCNRIVTSCIFSSSWNFVFPTPTSHPRFSWGQPQKSRYHHCKQYTTTPAIILYTSCTTNPYMSIHRIDQYVSLPPTGIDSYAKAIALGESERTSMAVSNASVGENGLTVGYRLCDELSRLLGPEGDRTLERLGVTRGRVHQVLAYHP